nr:hypothetical protein JVH1_5455 [Rhodococcus sp. JVH1]
MFLPYLRRRRPCTRRSARGIPRHVHLRTCCKTEGRTEAILDRDPGDHDRPVCALPGPPFRAVMTRRSTRPDPSGGEHAVTTRLSRRQLFGAATAGAVTVRWPPRVGHARCPACASGCRWVSPTTCPAR